MDKFSYDLEIAGLRDILEKWGMGGSGFGEPDPKHSETDAEELRVLRAENAQLKSLVEELENRLQERLN